MTYTIIGGASGGFFRHTRVSSQDASILGWTQGGPGLTGFFYNKGLLIFCVT